MDKIRGCLEGSVQRPLKKTPKNGETDPQNQPFWQFYQPLEESVEDLPHFLHHEYPSLFQIYYPVLGRN